MEQNSNKNFGNCVDPDFLNQDPEYKKLEAGKNYHEDEIKRLEKIVVNLEYNKRNIELNIQKLETGIQQREIPAIKIEGACRLIEELKKQLKTIEKELIEQTSEDNIQKREKLQEPLRKALARILSRMEERKREIEKEERRREQKRQETFKKRAIDIHRWISRNVNFDKREKYIGHVVANIANKKMKQVLTEICKIFELQIVDTSDLSQHYARKYSGYRLSKLKTQSLYLLPKNFSLKKQNIKKEP